MAPRVGSRSSKHIGSKRKNLLLRLDPKLHEQLLELAIAKGISVNSLIEELIRRRFD